MPVLYFMEASGLLAPISLPDIISKHKATRGSAGFGDSAIAGTRPGNRDEVY